MTKFVLVRRITLVGCFYYLIIELHLFKAGASAFVLGYGVGQASCTVFPIHLKFVWCDVVWVGGFPAEGVTLFHAIHIEAVFNPLLFEFLVGIPAELMVLTLVIAGTLLVDCTELGALRLEWPVAALSAVQPVLAVCVCFTIFIFAKTDANFFLAFHRLTLVLLRAVSSRKEILSQTSDFFTVRIKLLVLEHGGFKIRATRNVVQGLVKPGVFSVLEVKRAEKGSIARLGIGLIEAFSCDNKPIFFYFVFYSVALVCTLHY